MYGSIAFHNNKVGKIVTYLLVKSQDVELGTKVVHHGWKSLSRQRGWVVHKWLKDITIRALVSQDEKWLWWFVNGTKRVIGSFELWNCSHEDADIRNNR